MMKDKEGTSIFKKAQITYNEGGLIKLFRASFRHFLYYPYLLRRKYYLSRGRRIFSIGSAKIVMSVIDYNDYYELNYAYETERPIMERILRELKTEDVFWDVGANLGIYSLLAASCSKVNVVAFEPNPTTVISLRKNIELNKKANIKVLTVALSNSKGRARFNPEGVQLSHGRAHLVTEEIGETIEVETISGDKLIENGTAPRPDIIKIDVEGAEHLVIKGMSKALSNCRELFCEVHPNIEQYGSSAGDLEMTLKDIGFIIEKIQDRSDGTYSIIARHSWF
jgi:FkbM family methyltransferase